MHSVKYRILQGQDMQVGKTVFNKNSPNQLHFKNAINTLSTPCVPKTEQVKGFAIPLRNLLETGLERWCQKTSCSPAVKLAGDKDPHRRNPHYNVRFLKVPIFKGPGIDCGSLSRPTFIHPGTVGPELSIMPETMGGLMQVLTVFPTMSPNQAVVKDGFIN